MPHETIILASDANRVRSVTKTRGGINAAAPYKSGIPKNIEKIDKALEARLKNWTGGSKNPSPTKPGSRKKGGGM